jgi:hypothetical protein
MCKYGAAWCFYFVGVTLQEFGSRRKRRFEVLPDRLVLYLWPAAGGSSFDFNLSANPLHPFYMIITILKLLPNSLLSGG